MNENCYVDESIGTWCVAQDELNGKRPRHCIAIVKDVDEFCWAIDTVLEKIKNREPLNDLDEMIKLIEFGEVKISKDGVVKWQGGNFIQENDGNEGSRV